jgi:hypothetical protein
MRNQDLILIPQTNCSPHPLSLDRPIRIWLTYQYLNLGPMYQGLDEVSRSDIDTSNDVSAASTVFRLSDQDLDEVSRSHIKT